MRSTQARPRLTPRGRFQRLAGPGLPLVLCGIPLIVFITQVMLSPAGRADFLAAAMSPRSYRVAGFSLLQALLSASLACVLGLPLAFMYQRAKGARARAMRALFSLPFALPSILAATGFAGFLGISGLVNDVLAGLGLPRQAFIYGFQGILIVHAFFNFPLVARMTADSLARSNPALGEAARLLGAGPIRRFITIDLSEAGPGIAAAFLLSFLYCLQSLGIVLLLGGGPASSTFEVEILEALTSSFREGRALYFALMEGLLAMGAALAYARLVSMGPARSGLEMLRKAPLDSQGPVAKVASYAYASIILIFTFGPLVSLLYQAFRHPISGSQGAAFPSVGQFAFLVRSGFGGSFIKALFNSLSLGASAAILSTGLALLMPLLRGGKPCRIDSSLAILPMAVSPIILSSSIRGLLSPLGERVSLPLYHALIALPLTYSSVETGLSKLPPSLLEAARCLGATPRRAFADVAIPAIGPSIVSALAFSFCVSLTDLNGVLSMARSDFPVLSLLVFRLAGAYRYGAAAAAGLVLLALSGSAMALAWKEATWTAS